MLTDKMLEFKNVSCQGGKWSKKRLTRLVVANMSGTQKLPLPVIGKAAKPLCFKNVKSLPTKYTRNGKARMTSQIFSDWVKDVDKEMKKKIDIVVNNCPAHPNLTKLENVKLVFLPLNTTSKTQPMDQGVINNLKLHYRKVVVKYIHAIDKQTDFKLTMPDALSLLSESWDCITETTEANCFRHAGFVTIQEPREQQEDAEDDELDDIPLTSAMRLNSLTLSTSVRTFRHHHHSSLTDNDIISDVIECRSATGAVPDEPEDDEIDNAEPASVPSSEDAMDHLKCLEHHFQAKGGSEGHLQML